MGNQIVIDSEEYRKLTEEIEERRYLHKYIEKIITSIAESIIIVGMYTESDCIIKTVNNATAELLEYSYEEIVGMNILEIVEEKEWLTCLVNDSCSVLRSIDLTYNGKDGKKVPVLFSASILENEFEGIKEMICVAQDLTMQKEAEKRLIEYATKDEMTGTYNRRTGIKMIEDSIDKIDKKGGELSICYIDVNDLKKVNDTVGHHLGDEMLEEVCEVLKNVGGVDFPVARLGGDEFLIIGMNRTEVDIKGVMDKVLGEFEKRNSRIDKKYNLSVSYGIKRYEKGNYNTVDEYISSADTEMYMMKKETKKGREVYR